ncbi:MAG TPA: penicillin-binding transpeptidase domain-containing protein [Opitutaceae bacterium]|nr:penicillin-binding transpeptidase domain-containing protein [Opitutaceae bacterium]
MPTSDVNLADRSGTLVESHKGYDPRIIFFYFAIAAMMVILAAGLAYQQLFKSGVHSEAERQQNQRRVVVPGPRGNIYDRDGRLLVGNRPVFSVVLYVDELRGELLQEYRLIHKNYVESTDDKQELPTNRQLWQIARVTVVQRYLDKVNAILHRSEKINARKLERHFQSALLLPYPLIEDLSPEEYARLIEELPVNSPLQVYSSYSRFYPYASAAAHTLGAVRIDEDADAEDMPGDDLMTFKMKGSTGRDGLEKRFDSILQGTAGGSIFRVDPSGFRINPPLEQLAPHRGKDIVSSIDIDLQKVAEDAIGDQAGAAVAIDVHTGEVLVLASKPDYDLSQFSPHATPEVVKQMNDSGAWINRALTGLYPPGSTFKTVVTIAGLLSGRLDPNDTSVDCEGVTYIGRSKKTCDSGDGRHGRVDLQHAISVSCDIYFYHHGIDIGPNLIAEQARRFHLDRPMGIELPETNRMIIPDPAWKRKYENAAWTDGDTANMAIGQGYILVTPLQMACYAASLARGEVYTKPTLIHDPNRPTQHTEPIGLTPAQRAVLVKGMIGCTLPGEGNTASVLSTIDAYRIPGVAIAGKTGTAQVPGHKNIAWFICFAPADNPQIAMAVAVEGDTPGETFAGGTHAAPVAALVMKKYFEKKAHPAQSAIAFPFSKS